MTTEYPPFPLDAWLVSHAREVATGTRELNRATADEIPFDADLVDEITQEFGALMAKRIVDLVGMTDREEVTRDPDIPALLTIVPITEPDKENDS